MKDGVLFFDVWTSFCRWPARQRGCRSSLANDVSIRRLPHSGVGAAANPTCEPRPKCKYEFATEEQRTLLFELSRYLKIDAVEADGQPVDFIQNPAIEGNASARKGNDLVAVVFPAPLSRRPELATALHLCRRRSLRRW